MKYLNPDGSEQDPTRDDWVFGFEFDGQHLVCEECAALVSKTASKASRHRQWHLTQGR